MSFQQQTSEKPRSRKDNRKFITTLLKTCGQVKLKSFDEIKLQVISDLNTFTNDITLIYDDNGDSLAHLSVKEDKYETVCLIIDSYLYILGINETFFNWLFSKNNNRENIFDLCAQKGNIKIIQYLYSIMSKTSESQLHLTDKANNLFHHAAQNNQCYPIIFFYEKLQNYFKDQLIIDIPNENGITPFHYACIKGSKEVMDLLLDLGVNINSVDKEGNSCLHYAVESNNKRVVKKLLVRGANRNIKNFEGDTPYDKAVKNRNNEIANILEMKNFFQTHFLGKKNVTAIKGNRNNLLLLFLVLFLVLFKLIYVCRLSSAGAGDFKTDFIPFIIDEFIQESYSSNITNYQDLFSKCILNGIMEKKNCYIEISITGITMLFDLALLIVVIYFLCFSMKIFTKKNTKKKVPSLAKLFEEDKPVCVKCRNKMEATTTHCIVCNSCVKEFDHHCFWLNNCINRKNRRKFIFFVCTMVSFLTMNLLFFTINIVISQNIYMSYFYEVVFGISCNNKNSETKCYNEQWKDQLVKGLFIAANGLLSIGCLYGLLFIVFPVIKGMCNCCQKKKSKRISEFEQNLLSQTASKASSSAGMFIESI